MTDLKMFFLVFVAVILGQWAGSAILFWAVVFLRW